MTQSSTNRSLTFRIQTVARHRTRVLARARRRRCRKMKSRQCFAGRPSPPGSSARRAAGSRPVGRLRRTVDEHGVGERPAEGTALLVGRTGHDLPVVLVGRVAPRRRLTGLTEFQRLLLRFRGELLVLLIEPRTGITRHRAPKGVGAKISSGSAGSKPKRQQGYCKNGSHRSFPSSEGPDRPPARG